MALVFRRRVGQDMADAYRWYEEQRAGLGEELLAALDALFSTIEEFPQTFARVRGNVRRAILNRFPSFCTQTITTCHIPSRQLRYSASLDALEKTRSFPADCNRARLRMRARETRAHRRSRHRFSFHDSSV